MLIVKSKIEERTMEFEQLKDEKKKKKRGDKYLNDLNRSHEKRWYQINYASQVGNKKDEGIKCSKSVSLGNRADEDQP